MSDCGVCYFSSEADGVCEVWNVRHIKKSRKEHRCIECGEIIPAGSSYESVFSVYEGEAETSATCEICREVRDAYRCDGDSWVIGTLWDDIAQSDFWPNFTTGCLEKLTTPAAKAEMIRRWQRWKGLRS